MALSSGSTTAVENVGPWLAAHHLSKLPCAGGGGKESNKFATGRTVVSILAHPLGDPDSHGPSISRGACSAPESAACSATSQTASVAGARSSTLRTVSASRGDFLVAGMGPEEENVICWACRSARMPEHSRAAHQAKCDTFRIFLKFTPCP